MLHIKQLHYSENFVLNTAQQKQLYGGSISFVITTEEKFDREREKVWQSYAEGDADIAKLTDKSISFDYEDSRQNDVFLLV